MAKERQYAFEQWVQEEFLRRDPEAVEDMVWMMAEMDLPVWALARIVGLPEDITAALIQDGNPGLAGEIAEMFAASVKARKWGLCGIAR